MLVQMWEAQNNFLKKLLTDDLFRSIIIHVDFLLYRNCIGVVKDMAHLLLTAVYFFSFSLGFYFFCPGLFAYKNCIGCLDK